MIKTESYKLGHETEVEIGKTYYFGQLWNGEGDGDELLESGAITMYTEDLDEVIVGFEPIEEIIDIDDPAQTMVKVTDIY